MKNIKQLFLGVLLVLTQINHLNSQEIFFEEWQQTCNKLPYYKDKLDYSNKSDKLSPNLILKAILGFLKTMQGSLSQDNLWTNNKCPITNFTYPIFQPFTQKLELPEGAQVSFHGDLHADVHSLIEYLHELKKQNILDNNFKIIKNNFYLAFLGDYTDRGNYGIECIYTLLRLKNENPDKVILVRGNHEDSAITFEYGFQKEVKTKFSTDSRHLLNQIKNIYELMPVAVYIGSDKEFLQCNHGGMDLGYLPHKLLEHKGNVAFDLLGNLNRKTNYKKLQTQNKQLYSEGHSEYLFFDMPPSEPMDLAHLWADFIFNNSENLKYDLIRNKCAFGEKATIDTLALSSTKEKAVVGVFRAHQHTQDTMNEEYILNKVEPGIAKLWKQNKKLGELWKGMVATFCVSPNNFYGTFYKFNYDTHGILTIGKDFEKDWKLEIKKIKTGSKALEN